MTFMNVVILILRDVCQKKTGKCGNFEKTGGGGGSTQIPLENGDLPKLKRFLVHSHCLNCKKLILLCTNVLAFLIIHSDLKTVFIAIWSLEQLLSIAPTMSNLSWMGLAAGRLPLAPLVVPSSLCAETTIGPVRMHWTSG